MKDIVYIIGAGRSGTTLLDILLGNAEDSFSCGELNRIAWRHGVPPNREEGSPAYEFWRSILASLVDGRQAYQELDELHHGYEYHSGYLKNFFARNYHVKYRDFILGLYKNIANTVPDKCLIDSSKYPGRAWALSNILPESEYRISYIYLKRDPISVVRSFQKQGIEQPPKSYFSANLYYFVVNFLCKLTILRLRSKGHNVVELKYEDLTNRPDSCLQKCQGLGFSATNIQDKLNSGQELSTGLLFDGNRIRIKDSLSLKPSSPVEPSGVKDYITRFLNIFLYSN